MGLTYLFLATSLNTGLQARVEDAFRGRAMAIYLSALLLGVPLGALIQGVLASLTDLRIVVVGSGVLLGVVRRCTSCVRYDRLRPLDENLDPDAHRSVAPGPTDDRGSATERCLIDTHVHVVSDDLARYPLQPSTFTGPWYETHPCSAEQLRAADGRRRCRSGGARTRGECVRLRQRYTLDAAAAHRGVHHGGVHRAT